VTPRQAIARLPALQGARVVRRLSSGPVSATWLLETKPGQIVLSIDTPLAARLGLDRQAEFALLEPLEPHGVAPLPVTVNAGQGLFAVQAIQGRPLTASEFRAPETLRALGKLLARVHRIPAPAPVIDLDAAIDRYARLARSRRAGGMARRAQALLAGLPRSGRLCLCHNDIHPANLLRLPDGELRLVDWEYAGLADPLYEFAVLAEHNGLGDRALQVVLAAYRGACGGPAGPDARAVAAWRPLYRQLRALWEAATAGR
jgi:thiamine kinase